MIQLRQMARKVSRTAHNKQPTQKYAVGILQKTYLSSFCFPLYSSRDLFAFLLVPFKCYMTTCYVFPYNGLLRTLVSVCKLM